MTGDVEPASPSPGGREGRPVVTVWAAMRARPLRFPFSRWPLRCWAYLIGGGLIGLALLMTLAALILAGVLLSVVGVGLLLLVGAVLLGIPVGRVERRRLRWVDEAPVPDPHGAQAGTGVLPRARIRLRERATWREFGYTAVLAVVFAGVGVCMALLLVCCAVLLAAPLLVRALAPEPVMFVPGQAVPDPAAALPFSALGVVGCVLAAYAGCLLGTAEAKVARFLLAPREEAYRERVIELTRSRARLSDAFEAERHRIERDLHDGAQQQLVALSMTLGLAQMELGNDDGTGTGSAAADELISRGRVEARRALDQLRDLVRGIHPRVLTDHGLNAAVSEIALRHPVPVTVDIDLPHRLPEPVETMAYFTVTESLANAGKHSAATQVAVTGSIRGKRLVLLITDDGRGGADPARGTGLSGLADRVAILEGRLLVSSPVGGPTQIRLDIPCSV